jgi:hypothetical protein
MRVRLSHASDRTPFNSHASSVGSIRVLRILARYSPRLGVRSDLKTDAQITTQS